MRDKFGGTFAPPLSDEKLAEYKALIDAQPESVTKDALNIVFRCCIEWWNAPESTGEGHPHPCGKGIIVDLDKPIADALWDSIPWKEELEMIQGLFDKIEGKELRDMAFHLLWHAKELELDREPMTKDKL